jgi:hypothetical protein
MPRCFRSVISAARRLIDSFAVHGLHEVLDAAVVVPVAVIELDEPHAALGQAGGPAGSWPRTSRRPAGAVQVEHVLRLVGEVHQLRHAGLHAERHLVLAMRVAISGSWTALWFSSRFSRDRVDHVPLLPLRHAAGRSRYSTASPFDRTRTP